MEGEYPLAKSTLDSIQVLGGAATGRSHQGKQHSEGYQHYLDFVFFDAEASKIYPLNVFNPVVLLEIPRYCSYPRSTTRESELSEISRLLQILSNDRRLKAGDVDPIEIKNGRIIIEGLILRYSYFASRNNEYQRRRTILWITISPTGKRVKDRGRIVSYDHLDKRRSFFGCHPL